MLRSVSRTCARRRIAISATQTTRRIILPAPLTRRAWYSSEAPSHPDAAEPAAVATGIPVTKIEKLILDSIKATGPMPVSTYMQYCLSMPHDGYYMSSGNPVFGAKGDFITSPEISQVFGEMTAIWMLSQWVKDGKPKSIRLVELGPGRGTLMADMLRTLYQLTPPGTVTDIHLVENSPAMQEMQKALLGPLTTDIGCKLHWHEDLTEVPAEETSPYTMIMAHEFFDALPIHIIQKRAEGWHEVMIDMDNAETRTTNLRLAISPTPSPTASVLGTSSPRFKDVAEDAQIEVSRAAFRVAKELADLVEKGGGGGCGLIVDYGADSPATDSFRAFKNHEMKSVFHQPGHCDLTADVDFGWLRSAMEGVVSPTETLTQSEFLLKMGLQQRVTKLVKESDSKRQDELVDSANRLVDPHGMGGQYRIMGFRKGYVQEAWPFMKLRDDSVGETKL